MLRSPLARKIGLAIRSRLSPTLLSVRAVRLREVLTRPSAGAELALSAVLALACSPIGSTCWSVEEGVAQDAVTGTFPDTELSVFNQERGAPIEGQLGFREGTFRAHAIVVRHFGISYGALAVGDGDTL